MRAEVYDAAGTEIVGYLEGVADLKVSRANSVTIVVDQGSEADPFPGAFLSTKPYRPVEYLPVEIGQMSRRYERSLMARDPEDFAAMVASVIPEHAETYEDIISNTITYHWKVLKMPPKPEEAEKLFDLDTFEPAGRSCEAWSAEERWWAKRGAMPGLHRFTIDASAIKAGAITADKLASSVSNLPASGRPPKSKGSWLRARER